MNMFVKQNKSWKGTLLTFTMGYRENGKIKHKNIETIGYLEDLKKLYDDPLKHFKEIAKQRSNNEVNELCIKNISSKVIDENSIQKNLGYLILKNIYNDLGLHKIFKFAQSKSNIKYNLNDIFQLLVYSRILFPGSKKETYDNKDVFFENFDFSLKDVYRSLDQMNELKDDIQLLLWNSTKKKYKRDTTNTFYDCTNYYFEIDYNDEDLVDENGNILEKGFRKRGPEKNHRPDPIIEMGLLMDATGIPLSYDLFSGSDSEKTSLRPIIKETKNKFNIGKTIVVADRGLNTSDNIFYISGKNDETCKNKDGYVYGQSVRGADKEFKDWVLSQDGYTNDFIFDENGDKLTYRARVLNKDGTLNHYEKCPLIFKHKSRVHAKNIQVKTDEGNIIKTIIYQKQLAYYSQKYADKQKRDRQIMIDKANDLIKNPCKYNKSTSYGACGFIKNIRFDKNTGAIPDGLDLSIDQNKIDEDSKYDGYYSIVTSEFEMSDQKMRDVYRGLSKIEETFKITKSSLEDRPVYVWTKEHIKAHFLTCFVALVITRLLEKNLNNKYPVDQIINTLIKYTSTNIEHDIYIQSFRNDIIKDCENAFNIDLSKKYLTLSNIKNILNNKKI